MRVCVHIWNNKDDSASVKRKFHTITVEPENIQSFISTYLENDYKITAMYCEDGEILDVRIEQRATQKVVVTTEKLVTTTKNHFLRIS